MSFAKLNSKNLPGLFSLSGPISHSHNEIYYIFHCNLICKKEFINIFFCFSR